MPRTARIEFPLAYYHVISRGIERRSIYKTNRDRFKFLEVLEEAKERFNLNIFAYFLMDNHYHLQLQTLEANLSKAMKYINGSYATYFNAKHKRVGHLFSYRYKSIVVDQDSYLVELSRYIHLNPVKAKIVTVPEEYRWSSFRDYVGYKKTEWLNVDWVLNIFSKNRKEAKQRYKDFVYRGIDGKGKNLLKEIVGGMVLGKKAFVDLMLKKVEPNLEAPGQKEPRRVYELAEIEDFVNQEQTLNVGLKRKIGIYLSREYSDKTLREIGEYFGGLKRQGVNMLIKRFSIELEKDKILEEMVEGLKKRLKG